MNGRTLLAVLLPPLVLTLLSHYTLLTANLSPLILVAVMAFLSSLATAILKGSTAGRKAVLSQSTSTSSSTSTAANKEQGLVKWFNASKGFGFITRSNGDEIFVHYRSLGNGRPLREGQKVEFVVTTGPKGLQAEEVAILK